MSKTRRLITVIVVLAIAFAFLFPTIQWYMLTPKEDQAIAVGSREQIRDFSRRMAYSILMDIKNKALAGDTTDLSNQSKDMALVVSVAKKAYSDAKRPQPKKYDAASILAAFSSERAMFDAVEARFRERTLALKNLHGKALQLGLDLAGGMSVVIQADMKALAEKLGHDLSPAEREDAMKRGVEVLNSRIDKFGLTEPVIRRQGEDQIYVEIPGTPILKGSIRLSWARVISRSIL